ncbi:hypothetical protein CkaCkLH20_07502 [Colletotrichum karsti]|uniref:Telomeric single stranded DNA binding POT1/Cdc13 domain-containing protein n=1 Tax=Colletotrichum karsti TaxID=1095194 RepID=A0A9P6I038_9PEZI|nr:uncharacterized protein CkaCkLH20_07502 [Colletotrichum karsti]KAF9874808.1 hypothetical protein CkaCkLH20_07502 [Colletotrichum karsti]
MSGDQAPSQLEAAEGIPIAQLSPDVSDAKTRVVRGVVTITWPYSIINKNVAFLLAEPDFRLRRAKGQVRVEFSGSSAKAVQDAGLGSGDEVTLSLDGVEMVADDSKTRVPGTSLEWQLKFTERLLLRAKISDSEEIKVIDIDHPAITEPEPQPEPEKLPESILDSFTEPAKPHEPVATPRNPPTKRPAEQSLGLDEYASPAFLKRARMSYGSLFEYNSDIFDEDTSANARTKKRAKTGRYSGVWRYASKSPSPEPEQVEDDDTDDTSMADEKPETDTPVRPKMVDGGCQTMELDTSPPRDVQVAAEARHDPSQFLQTPTKSTMIDSGVQSDLPGLAETPHFGMPAGLSGDFGQPPPMPIFTSAHEHYTPAYEQQPVGPDLGHDVHHGSMGPQYHAESPFHEHASSYPEAALDDGLEAPAQYPASFLDTPQFDPHLMVTSQSMPESTPAYHDHHTPQPHVSEPEHHTTFVDAVAEPQQIPWGLTSMQQPRPVAEPADNAASTFDPAVSKEEVVNTEQELGTQAVPSDTWAEDHELQTKEHHEDPEGKQAAMTVEDDELSEDEDGPEEEFTARTYAERHFEPAKEKEEAAAGLENAPASSESSDGSEDSDEEAEHEEDDVGGDYDITNYRNLSNNQDDDDGSDLESDYGQEDEEEMFDADVQGDEDDEMDEDAENYGEYDEYEEEGDYDEDEDQENQPPPATVPRGAPQVISLLSDSEDEEEDAPPPMPKASIRQMPQYDGSADEMDRSEDEEESDKENVRHEPVQQNSSPVVSDVESEEDEASGSESEGGTPTPKPREITSNPGSTRSVDASSPAAMHDPADMTTATVADDLETMSPIRLPQSTELPKDSSSRPASRDDSEMLEAELEQELEQEIAADAAFDDSKIPDEPEVLTEQVSEVPTEDQAVPAEEEIVSTEEKSVLVEEQAVPTEVQAASAEDEIAETEEQAALTEKPAQVIASEVLDTTVSEVKVESEVRTEEVRNIPQESSLVEVDVKPADGVVPEEMDINMADADEKPVDESDIREQSEDPRMDVAKTPEPLLEEMMDEEDLIQSQLADETMAEERTLVIETTETISQHEVPANELEETSSPMSSPIVQITERLQVEITSSTADTPAATQQEDEGVPKLDLEDAMDVDEPEAKQQEMASPPPTQNLSQSFEEERLAETHVSQGADGDDVAQFDQLPTPRETQVTESFVSQSVVETQQTEEVIADAASPDATNDVRPDEELPAPTVENPENPADPSSPINEESSQIRDSSAQPSEAQSSLIAEEASEEAGNAQPTPKRGRGHRRNKSDNKDPDPSVKLARASIASRRSTRLSDRTTPESTRVATRARSQSLALRSESADDGEDEGVQLARAAIKSPSRATKETTKETKEEVPATTTDTTASLKTKLAKQLQKVPDCISLKVLRNHTNKNVDVLAIVTTEPPEAKRAKGGPRGIMLAFNVADHSVAPTQTAPVQIFRPHKAALPVVHPGDAILLRHVCIQSVKGRGFGLRANDASSWAVFERDGEDGLPQIRGPPVELTEEEMKYAALLKQWYAGLDAKTLAKFDKANDADA